MQVFDSQLHCLLCGIPLTQVLMNVKDTDGTEIFSILQCVNCKLGVTHPHPSNIADYYTDVYRVNRHGFTARHCARRRLKWINQFYKNNNGKLLDIGCGEGTFLLAAKHAGWEALGTELNPNIALSRNIDVKKCLDEVQSLAPFNCITLWHSLEHMYDPQDMISSLHSLLAPNGMVFIAVPNAQGWQAKIFGEKWLHRDVPRHLYHFSKQSLLRLLHINGYKVQKIWHQEFEYDLLGWSQSMLNHLCQSQNVFFGLLTKRKIASTQVTQLMNWLGGFFFSFVALPLVPLASLFGAGGTIIFAARKSPACDRKVPIAL